MTDGYKVKNKGLESDMRVVSKYNWPYSDDYREKYNNQADVKKGRK